MVEPVAGYDLGLIAARLEESAIRDVEGGVGFDGSTFKDLEVLLRSAVRFSDEVPSLAHRRMVAQGATVAAKRGKITAASLLREMAKLEGSYLAQPTARFRMITSISAASHVLPNLVRLGGITITFSPALSRRVRRERDSFERNVAKAFPVPIPANYTPVSVLLHARSQDAAADAALRMLDVIRAAWNLAFHRGTLSRSTWGGQRKPVNLLMLGPIHTIHREHAGQPFESWWYEPQYAGPIDVFNKKRDFEAAHVYGKSVLKRLTRHPYRGDLVNALVRYVRALDSRDWDDSFLKLWSVLEFLTDSTRADAKVKIRRTSFLYEDTEFVHQLVRHLSEYRNRAVHVGEGHDEIEILLYQLKGVVDQLLQFHLGSSLGFKSLSDAADFMDLPSGRAAIDERIKQLKIARRFVVS